MSLVYYGWWNPRYLVLLGFSIASNFTLGRWLGRDDRRGRKLALAAGIAANLGLLGYFKYTFFVLETCNTLAGTEWSWVTIVLPIGISFFTFQQIAYLVDAYRGEAREYKLVDYILFVTFFPQLIAGPIVHHKEMLPQFTRRGRYRLNSRDLSIGVTMFVFGLFNKVVLADNLARFATPVFQ